MGVLSYTMNNMPPVGQIYGSQVAATGSIDPRMRSHIQKARLDEGQGAGFNANDGFAQPAPSDWNPRSLGAALE